MKQKYNQKIMIVIVSLIIFLILTMYVMSCTMADKKETSERLNKTLLFLITLLNNNNIGNWFVCYGTLLGLVRENSCIDNDDDIDIIIEKSNYDIIKKLLIDNNFKLTFGHGINKSKNIIKTKTNSDYASIDIYMGDFGSTHVFDMWNKLNIKDCFFDIENKTFIKENWKGQNIYYPNNYKRLLINRYGNDWNIKKDVKIPQTMKEL
jgi:phosphorylcholine metabolism protein LicD